jgi:hypothetical protein
MLNNKFLKTRVAQWVKWLDYLTTRTLDFQLPMQSVPSPTKVVSSNPTHGAVYSIHYVIKFVSDLQQVCGFLRHNIFEILLKVALNTIKQTYSLKPP